VDGRYDEFERRRTAWMREMEYRRRNIVFPETAMNSGHFWRHLAYSSYPLNLAQKIGVAVLLFGSGVPYVLFLAGREIFYAVLGNHLGIREPSGRGIAALVFSQVLTIAVAMRILFSVLKTKKPLDDIRLPLRRRPRAGR
jgi:hypothetical protein